MVDLVTNTLTKKEIEAYINKLSTASDEGPALVPELAEVNTRQRKADLIFEINTVISTHNAHAAAPIEEEELDGESQPRYLRWMVYAIVILLLLWILL